MENDITSMQQEAANRVREMQRRAREKIKNTEDFKNKENENVEKDCCCSACDRDDGWSPRQLRHEIAR